MIVYFLLRTPKQWTVSGGPNREEGRPRPDHKPHHHRIAHLPRSVVRGRSVSDSCRERMRPFTHRPIVIRPRLIDVEGVIRRQWPALGRPEWFTSTRVCFVACCDFDLLAECREDLGNLPGQAIRSAFEIGQAVANYIAYDTVTWNKVSLAGATGTTRVTSTHHSRTKTGRWCSPCSGPACTAAPGTDGRAT